MTDGILRCVNTKNLRYKQWKRTPCEHPQYVDRENSYKLYDSMHKRIIRQRKLEFHTSFFSQHKNDMKKTWSGIKHLISKNCSNDSEQEFKCDGKITSDANTISNNFNNYFSTIGTTYANNIPDVAGVSYNDYLTKNTSSVFKFETVSCNHIVKTIDKLKSKDSYGHDGISVKLLKYVKHILAPILTPIINQSLSQGIFPQHLKLAKVTPIFKSGSKAEFSNYRPISVLPSVSKVFEKTISNQLSQYFEQNKLLPTNQYAYRDLHCSEHATLEFVDKLIEMLDNDKTPLAIFIDLSKAFDTIDHTILIKKLEYYGLEPDAIRLIQHYLTDRQQYVYWNNNSSLCSDVSIGVPQGSILGPLMFIIYMADFENSSDLFSFINYADDTTLYLDISEPHVTTNLINIEIDKVSNWLKVNKLSINPKKTKLMTFSYRKKVDDPILKLGNDVITPVEHFDFLGLRIDKHLTWKHHINKTANKLSRINFVLNKLKRFLPLNILRTMYFSLFQSHLNFGILHWGHTIKDGQPCDILTKLQKRAMRIITNSPYSCHTTPLFKALEVLKLKDMFNYFVLKFAYRFHNHILPGYFLTNFKFLRSHDVHTYRMRNDSIRHPRLNLTKSHQCMRVYLLNVMNQFPNIVTEKIQTHSECGFSQYSKRYFLTHYQDSCSIHNCYTCHRE